MRGHLLQYPFRPRPRSYAELFRRVSRGNRSALVFGGGIQLYEGFEPAQSDWNSSTAARLFMEVNQVQCILLRLFECRRRGGRVPAFVLDYIDHVTRQEHAVHSLADARQDVLEEHRPLRSPRQ